MSVRVRLVLVVLCMMVAVYGCDKLKDMGLSPKPVSTDQALVQETPVVRGTVVARVNNLAITLEELEQEIEAYNSLVPEDRPEARITTREQKITYLKDQMVRALLLYQAALDRRLDTNEEVARILERTKRELLVMELLRQETEKIDVSSEEIEEYYEMYKNTVKPPEERKIREIVVASEQEAKDILIQLLQGADFSTLARERSRAQSARDGGDLGFLKPGEKSPEFDKVAFSDALEEGQVSSIFRGPEGYYLIKVEEIRTGKTLTITEAWDDIKQFLTFQKQQEKIEGLLNELSNSARKEIYESEIR